jgi:hypothetical protein
VVCKGHSHYADATIRPPTHQGREESVSRPPVSLTMDPHPITVKQGSLTPFSHLLGHIELGGSKPSLVAITRKVDGTGLARRSLPCAQQLHMHAQVVRH